MSKRLLILGAGLQQIPAITLAKKKGYYVIVCDMNESAAGKDFCDEFYVINTVDKDAVLHLAKSTNVDGVMTYASDRASLTVAYVAEKLGLPGNPYESVLILTNKQRFRQFQKENNLFLPLSFSFIDVQKAWDSLNKFNCNVIMKPSDNCGSKGIVSFDSNTISREGFEKYFESAKAYSLNGVVVLEEFINRNGYQIAGDGFLVDGSLVFRCFANEHFNVNVNRLVPTGESFPSISSKDIQDKAHEIAQYIFSKLNMKIGAINFDFAITENRDVFFIELGPRNGGNLIPKVIHFITGVDLIDYTIEAHLGHDCSNLKMTKTEGFYSSYMAHSEKDGIFEDIAISESIKSKVIYKNIYVKKGEEIKKYNSGNLAIGEMVLKFENLDEMLEMMDNMSKYITVKVLSRA